MLGALVSIFKKGIFYILAREYADQGIPFYRSSNVGEILPKEDGLAFISPAKHKTEYKTALKTGDLMIVKTGRSGASVVLTPHCNVSQDVIAVKVRSERVNPYFLALYLNTTFGSSEMNRWFQGQDQPHLSLEDARRILIALVSDEEQLKIEVLVKASARSLSDSVAAYSQAQQLLESELGLDKLTFQKPVGYVARLSDIELFRRFDPEHYFPAFNAFCAGLPAGITFSPLSNHLELCQRGKQPIYAKAGLPVINSKHVQPNRVIQEGNRFALANPVSDLQIRFGDTLINGTGRGTIGRAAPYLSETLAVADNHVTILRSSSLDPAFLSLYLNSAAGQMQVEMHQRGTSGQLELYPFDIRKFLVWPAPWSLQRELRDLYDKATSAERESRQLLEQAKARVEQLIEEAAQP
jgi:restriction endonuclease S subunit